MLRKLFDGSADRLPPILAWLLGALVFFSTFSIAGTQTSLVLVIAVWIVLMLLRRSPRFGRTGLDLPIILFVCASLAAAAFSSEKLASFTHLKNLLLWSAVYVVGALLVDGRLGRRLFAVLMAAGAASALYGIAVYLLGRGEGILGRTPGSFSTPMTFGGVLLILCSFAAAAALVPGIGRRARIGCFLAAAALFAALLFTFTRGSWIGAVVSVVVILALVRKRFLVPFAAAIVALFLVLPGVYRERVSTMWSTHFGTNVQRLEMLSGGWRIFKDHPVIGVGTMDLHEIYARYKPPTAVHVHGHMHNNFLQIAVQMGSVGLVAFIVLIVAVYRLLVRNMRLALPPPARAFVAGTIGAFTGFLVNGLFDFTMGDAEIITLLFLAIGANVAMSRRADVFGAVDQAHSVK